MSEKKITGRWSDDEHQGYLKGLKEFGENYKLIQTYVPTRSCQQIRTHHRTSEMKKKTGSPSPSKKRKNEEDVKSQNKKKKGAVKESKSAKGVAMPLKQQPIPRSFPTLKKIFNFSKKAKGESLKPPTDLPSVVQPKGSPKKKSKKPLRIEPVAVIPKSPVVSEEETFSGGKFEFLLREDVQACVAGVFGFASVLLAKKIMAN